MTLQIKPSDNFLKNIDKWSDLTSYYRWNPDLFFDLIKKENGGVNLDDDQRIFLRSISRFVSLHGVFPRGYG